MVKQYLDYEGLENFRQVQKITDQVLVDNNSILLLDGDQFDVYLMPEKCVVYILSNGASVYKRGCFYEVTHTEISNPSGNPRSKWYYEKVPASYFTVMGLGPKAAAALADTLYTRSQDTSVNPSKTYYDRNRNYLFNKLAYAQILGTMPTAGSAWDGYCVYYRGEDTADYKKGHTYYCSGSGSTYTWTDISLKGIQVTVLPTASADELGNIYQYVGVTDIDYTNGYFYECVSDGEATPTYSWEQKDVQPQTSGDYIEKVTTMPTASSDELGKEYQYMGADDSTNGLIHAHFYECVSDGESTPTYSWHDLGYQKVWTGHKADWDALSVAERVQYDEAHFDDDEGSNQKQWFADQLELSDYEEIILGTSASNAIQVQYDGFINININSSGNGAAYISSDNKSTWKQAWNSTTDASYGKGGFIAVTKGDYVYAPGYVNTKVCYARFYKKRDYSMR